MNILFLSDNFPPESNAPASRTHEHCRRWVERGHRVVVVTCAPNFPRGEVFEGYRNRLYQKETIDGIEVIRVWTYITANEGFAKRILDYLSFMTAAVPAALFTRRPDIIVATSPQLFTAVAGWIVSILKWRPWVFELRDLWPESIGAMEALRARPALRAIEACSHFLYRRASLIVPVTETFAERLEALGIDRSRICVVTNGVDPEKVRVERSPAEVRAGYGIPENAMVAAYVGTVGLAHGVGTIVEAATLTRDDPALHYAIMGEGADKQSVRRRIEERGLTNVTLIDGKPRQAAFELVNAADASLVLLRDLPVFETVIPSKIFEAMVLGKPVVLGVRGEARRIVVDEADCGLAFPPEDAEALAAALRRLAGDAQLRARLGTNGREMLERRFRRTVLADRMLEALATRTSRRPG